MTAKQTLETARLKLRDVDLSDSAFLLRLLNHPSWLENIGDRGVHSEADAAEYIQHNIHHHFQSHGYGMYGVQLKQSARLIGLCGLVKRDFLPAPDLGFALLPDFVGHGYAFEAARAVMVHAQNELAVAQLYAIVNSSNRRSISLLHRLGFHRESASSIPQGLDIDLYATSLKELSSGCVSSQAVGGAGR